MKYRPLGLLLFLGYFILVRTLRYQRTDNIKSTFSKGGRALSSMTPKEAHDIITQLQELEFPFAFNKARSIALLKAGGIPTMSKLFAATGQHTHKNAGKRAVDTEILLRETQSQERDSLRYMCAIARMNFFHTRYRQAGKILDADMLHTLGSNVVEVLRILGEDEWRDLSNVEKCALGVFTKNLGDDLGVEYGLMDSGGRGWADGLEFVVKLRDWTKGYEEEVARPVETGNRYVRVYVDSLTTSMPRSVTTLSRKVLGFELSDVMRKSLYIEKPGSILTPLLYTFKNLRKFYLRHLSLPRLIPIPIVEETPNPVSGLYNFKHVSFQPWYVKPSFSSIWSFSAILMRALGGRKPGTGGERYYPGGYDLMTIGPQPNEGKGIEEMEATIRFMKERGSSGCPFSGGGK